jgi:hypothetical protein
VQTILNVPNNFSKILSITFDKCVSGIKQVDPGVVAVPIICTASVLLFLGLVLSCGLDLEDPTIPSPPQWIPKSLPEEWPERGIDAHESGGIFLEWAPNPEDIIAAYLIYSTQNYDENDSLGDYELLQRIEVESNMVLNYIHSDAIIHTKYFYKLKAENNSKDLSDFSDALEYTLLPAISSNIMTPNGNTDVIGTSRQLIWGYDYRIEMENYCLTIITRSDSCIARVVLSPTNYIDGSESWIIPGTVVLDSNTVYKWRIDTGAKYMNELETFGSESNWATFLYLCE